LANYLEDLKIAQENLDKIGKNKTDWLEEQRKRQLLAEGLLQNYNEGRSMSFYCKTCTRMSIELINEAIKEAKKRFTSEKVDKSDIKSKAKILNSIIKDICLSSNVNMG